VQQVRHIGRDCPNKAAHVTVDYTPAGEHDEADDLPTFMICDDRVCTYTSVVLFLPTEVLLNNAACQCVFSNPRLVHSSVHILEKCRGVKRVDKNASSLAIESEGLFVDLTCKINVAKDSAANLLSQALLKDLGCEISYNSAADHFVVPTASSELVFSRKLHPDGDTMSGIWQSSYRHTS
jgi:hypothetical protein